MYVASEWYGILTVDITNIYNEIDLGKTATGGWCHGSSFAKNRLAEASEGYGVRLFDMSIMQTPQLIAVDTTVGFCRAISIADSADYVYAWFLTGKRLRVYSGSNLSYQSDTTVDPNTLIISDFARSRYKNGKVAVIEDIAQGNKKIVAGDVSNPQQPFINATRRSNKVNDLLFHSNGKLFACTDDTLYVLDPSNLGTLGFAVPPLQNLQFYKAFTLLNDTLYVYYSGIGEGIAKYFYDVNLQTLTYLSAAAYNLNTTGRVFMASYSGCLFIGSTIDKLVAINKNAPHSTIATYDHGADFIYDNLWGNTDLYVRNGYLFLNEYMGQTSVFGSPTPAGIQTISNKEDLLIYPNPARDHFTIRTETSEESSVFMYDAQGKLVYSSDVRSEQVQLPTSGFEPGIYFMIVRSSISERNCKVVIEK
jgi:hypothetical protein